jgi:hypothetical protein
VDQALTCLGKQIGIHQRRLRERRKSAVTSSAALRVAPLWIISSGRPDGAIQDLGMQLLRQWPNGVYRMGLAALPMHIVVLSELPRERETLMLRLMGAKRVLREALEDLQILPDEAWERRAAVDAIDVLRSFATEAAGLIDRDEEAIIMGATETYERIKGEGREEGRQEGRREGRYEGVLEGERRILLRQLEVRFGSLSERVVARVKAADATELERWAVRIMSAANAEQVVER